jgi:DnaJ-class molecular chaperone
LLKEHPKVVKSLACKYLNIPLDIINPKTVVKIPHEGIPYVEHTEVEDPENVENDGKKIVEVHKAGNLYVKFNIQFPTGLTLAQREQMLKVFKNEDVDN